MKAPTSDSSASKFYLLDMGSEKYGDCILCVAGSKTILIDGGHLSDWQGQQGSQSIPDQLASILGDPPFNISLLIVTHCHSDHVGCLPKMVENGVLLPKWALVADPHLGFGRDAGGQDAASFALLPEPVQRVVAALREEDRSDLTDPELDTFLADAARLEDRYNEMLDRLAAENTKVVRYGKDDTIALEAAFRSTGLEILGPTQDHLLICAEAIARSTRDAISRVTDALRMDAQAPLAELYRAQVEVASAADALDRPGKGAALNNQSIVVKFKTSRGSALFAGDMQFAAPEVSGLAPYMEELAGKVAEAGPYRFVKLTHHTSYNGLNPDLLDAFGKPALLAHTGGVNDATHPDPGTLALLERRSQITLARTDRNGLIGVDLAQGFEIAKGELNDFSENAARDVEAMQPESEVAAAAAEVLTAESGAAGFAPFPLAGKGAPAIELLFARIPFEAGSVSLGGFTIQVERRGDRGDLRTLRQPPPPPPPPPNKSLSTEARIPRLASGRILPKLLFVTRGAKACGQYRRAGSGHRAHDDP
jgi:beta-lactamase superfamily II metal-dependent hydrolase